jgi:phosphoribosylglycinamide formyltransferase-1
MGSEPIAVFASGSGTTFNEIVKYSLAANRSYYVNCLVSNRRNCGAVAFAKSHEIDIIDYDHETVRKLGYKGVKLVVLAGFLKILEHNIIEKYAEKILNIHPSLLPSFGGKGFYGIKVHEAVIESGVKYSGFTVHLVTEGIDKGPIIYQQIIPVSENDSSESLQERVHSLELQYYPRIIDAVVENGLKVSNGKAFFMDH